MALLVALKVLDFLNLGSKGQLLVEMNLLGSLKLIKVKNQHQKAFLTHIIDKRVLQETIHQL